MNLALLHEQAHDLFESSALRLAPRAGLAPLSVVAEGGAFVFRNHPILARARSQVKNYKVLGQVLTFMPEHV
jgi:hypothetical protein